MVMRATPTNNTVPLRPADFSSLAEALDYAALGSTGYNFYSTRTGLYAALAFAELRSQARSLAQRLLSLRLARQARVALVAETHPDFLRFFFACQYAGLVPVPLPVSVNLGSHAAYVRQVRGMLRTCRASVAVAPTGLVRLVREASQGFGLRFVGDPETFEREHPESPVELRSLGASELAYLQYTSGSTRFPRGVMISQETVLANLAGIIVDGLKIEAGDRCMSWLPFYHDMGLVGLVLAPLASQLSVDYLDTREFAMRPRQWLSLMSRGKATISFSPPFGYELCVHRLRPHDVAGFDLSHWRVAGIGAETIRPGPLERFADAVAPAGFDRRAFLPCYGMAECSLAVSFAPLGGGVRVDHVDSDRLAHRHRASPVSQEQAGQSNSRVSALVDCGTPLPSFDVEVRDPQGCALPERRLGTLYVKGPSVMSGYFGDPESTGEVLSAEGWLNTGDLGYRIGNRLVITGRQKDLIIINGRNIWPQDLEFLAEQQPEVRSGDALAFAAPAPGGEDRTMLVVQCREAEPRRRRHLAARLQRRVREELGIDCTVELVPLHTLPRTSSGKLSRSKARLDFVARQAGDAACAAWEPAEPEGRRDTGVP